MEIPVMVGAGLVVKIQTAMLIAAALIEGIGFAALFAV
jgi:hypothetical protein